MRRSNSVSPRSCRPDPTFFKIRMARLVTYALNPNKAEECKRYFMLNSPDNPQTLKIRQKLQDILQQTNLNEYIAKVLTTKTYLHKEGRKHIEQAIRYNGIANNKLRGKVSSKALVAVN